MTKWKYYFAYRMEVNAQISILIDRWSVFFLADIVNVNEKSMSFTFAAFFVL